MGRVKIKSGNEITKLRSTKNKQVLKTKTKTDTGTRRAKVVAKKGSPVKKVVSTKKRKTYSKDISGRGAKIGAAVGGAVGGAVGHATTNKTPSYKMKGKGSNTTNAKGTLPYHKHIDTYVDGSTKTKVHGIGGRTYKGYNNAGYKAGMVGFGATAGALAGAKMQKKNKKTKTKTVRSRTKTVGGVNKTAQRQKVRDTKSKMRAKKRNIRRG